jgi:two-component system, NtrC family, nitrogen regulation sensor histidine kinase NtrY
MRLCRNAGPPVVAATFVAGSGAVTLTWGATIRERMELAAYDITRLSGVDDNALELLERFARFIDTDSVRLSAPDALLRQYASSELAMAGYPARLALTELRMIVRPANWSSSLSVCRSWWKPVYARSHQILGS